MSGKRAFACLLLVVLSSANTAPVHANEHKVTICHKDRNEIVVDFHAVPAHLEHGDVVGPCVPPVIL